MTKNPKQSLNNTPESSQRPLKIQKTVEDQTDNNTEQNPEEEEVNIPKPMNQNPKLQRYLVAIEYMGTRFSGSQKQLNCRTVVGVLEVVY